MEMLSGILSIIKELKNIIVMALDFIPKLHDKKKRHICELVLQYISINGSVDALDLKSLYRFLKIDCTYQLKQMFKYGGLKVALEYYLLEDEKCYSLEEKRELLKYIESNEQKINAKVYIDKAKQEKRTVKQYLDNRCISIFVSMIMFMCLFYLIGGFEWSLFIIVPIMLLFLPIISVLMIMLIDYFEYRVDNSFVNGWGVKLLDRCYSKHKCIRDFFDYYAK